MRIKRALIALGAAGLTLSFVSQRGEASGPPITPAIVQIMTSSVTATWSLPLPTSGYVIEASTFPAFTGGIFSTTTFNQNTSTLTVGGLSPNTTYYFRAGALYSGTTSFTVTNPTSTVTLTQLLTGGFIMQVTPNSIMVRWNNLSNSAGYLLQVSTDNFFNPVAASTGTFNTAITTLTVNGLASGTTYFIRAGALNWQFNPNFIVLGSTLTPGSGGAPAPTGLAGFALGQSSIAWTWNAVSSATSYGVYVTTEPGTAIALGIATTTFVETGLDINSQYSRSVTAVVASSESAPSSGVALYTLAVPPSVPSFTNIGLSSVTVNWSPQGNPAGTRYEVSRSSTPSFTTGVSTPIAFTQNFTGTTTDFAGLNSGTTFYFRVRAENGSTVVTAFSSVNGFMTLFLPVNAPTGLAGTAQGVSSITWTWSAVSSATYNLYMATSPTTVIASGIGPNNYIEVGLSTNTSYSRVVTAVVASSESALSNSATAYTKAAVPGGPTYSFISNSSATLTWSANTNPAGTSYEVTRSSHVGFSGSTTMVSFGANFTGTTTAFFTLTPGTTYYFRVRARNGAFIPAAFSPITSLTTLGSGGGSSGSGTGSAAVLPTTVPEAGVVTATMTFTVPTSGMSTGGKLEIALPSSWGTPLQTTNPGQPGYVSVSGGSFSVNPSSQGVLLTLSSGFLSNGSIVNVAFQNLYTNCPTQTFPQAQWKVRSAMTSTDALGDVGAPAPETYTTGPLNSVNFVPWNVITIGANQSSPALLLQTSDSCGQPVPLAAPLTLTWTGLLPDQTNTDATIQFSTNSFATTTNSFTIPASTSMAVFYIRSTTAGNNRWIRGSYTHPINGNPYQAWRQVNILSQSFAFNSVSVDNGTPVNGQTSLTLTPDADGMNDNATIRFVPNDPNTTWHVAISSDGFQYSVFERWGSSNPLSSLLWDGRDQHTNYFVPNSIYTVKLEDVNGTAVNTSLLITVTTAKISGQITLGGVPVAGALVNAYGTGSTAAAYAAARTDSAGNYSVYGLHSGSTYNLYASFISTTTQAQISGQIVNITAPSTGRNLALANPGVLRISAVSPAAAAVAVYGNLNIYNNTANYGGNIHLSAGSTASDNGDPFNPSTWTILGLAPSTYTLHLNMQGYAAADQTVTVTAGMTTDVTLTLTARANVYGQITLPAPAGASIWVPVQGTPQGSNFPTVYGGAFFNVGQQNAIYSLFAVAPGTYTFTAQPPGLIPEKQTNVTVGSADIGNSSTGGLDFSGFGTGGEINGVIALHGDTTALPNPFTIWINAFSPQLGQNAFVQVQLVPDANNTAAGYILSGLADGVYQLNPPYMPGFSAPGGMTNVLVNGGVPTTVNIDLYENTGRITGAVHLPNGNVDYANVHISLQGPVSQEKDLTGATYSLDQLDTGFYRLIASYLTTGAQVRMNIPVTNGTAPQNIPIDLAISTYSVSGTVSVQSGFTMTDSSGAAVTITTIQNLLEAATQQTLILGGAQTYSGTAAACAGGIPTVVTTARVEAFPKDFDSYNQANRNGVANCFGVNQYKYGTIAADGSYSISGLTPGIWEIDVYPYFDGGNSPNVAVQKQVVSIQNSNNTTTNFALAGGNTVAGTLNLPDGVSDVRSFTLQVQSDRGDIVQSAVRDIGTAGNPAASATYSFSHLAVGNYSLVLRDQGTFDSTLNRNVIRYVAKPVQFQITGGDLTSVNMTLALASRIVGKLAIQGANPDGTSALTLITPNNTNLLSRNFNIQAQANPWVPSGYAQANYSANGGGIDINSDNQFSIDGLIAGTYDVFFRQFTYGASTLGSLDLAAYTQGGVVVPQGQTLDLGTITLQPGLAVSGLVTDTSGTPLPNIRVRAQPSNSQHGSDSQEVFTNSTGQFTFTGLSPKVKVYDFVAAPRPSPNDTVQPVPFGQVKKRTVDVTQVPPPNLTFALPTAVAGFSGTVVTVDGGALSFPNGEQSGYPAAAVFVNLQGNAAAEDPLGDDNATALDGTFNITNLPAGVYDLTIESLGYRPVKMTGLTLSNAVRALGTITLQTGPALTATLTKPDGSAVNTSDVHQAVAASADLSSIIFGQINSDAQTGNILSIKFAGFELTPKTYSVLLFDTHDNIIVPQEGRNLSFTTNTDSLAKAITFQPTAPQALVNIQKPGSDVLITFYFSRPIRNGVNDQDPTTWLSHNGAGTLASITLSGDRRSLSAVYTPSGSEQNATVQFSAHTVDIDPATGVEYVLAKSVTLLLGQIATAEQSINPAIGGNVSLSDALDTTQVAIPANALLNTNGTAADATASYAFTLSATDDATTAGASALSHAPRVAGMMRRGAGAYLSEAYSAMQAARAQATINPLSSFYSILLPAGISHSLNQTATLTLNYDTTADPNQINIYFYNGSQYIIETALRTVDTVNHTISVGVSHFSTFVVLENNQPVIQVNGDASSGSDISVYNFPNPFNLDSKTKTLTHGGTSSSLTTEGTVIHYTIPTAKLGSASIDIFNVVGEKVRSISLGVPAGDTHNYVEWDGRNDSGKKVASGVYIGMLKVGSEKKFFKMAVIK